MKTTFWEKNKRTLCNLILVAVLVALVGCVDAFAPSSSMWFPCCARCVPSRWRRWP